MPIKVEGRFLPMISETTKTGKTIKIQNRLYIAWLRRLCLDSKVIDKELFITLPTGGLIKGLGSFIAYGC